MPWCETCDKWKAPNGLLPGGICPRCGETVETGAVAAEAHVHGAGAGAAGGGAAAEPVKIPWHFWVMVAAAAIYLGWRVIQGLIALF